MPRPRTHDDRTGRVFPDHLITCQVLILHPGDSALPRAPKMAAELPYSPEVLALWNEKDEEASEKWRQEKIKDFEAGGPTKGKHETSVKNQARSGQPGCQRGGSHGGWAEAGRGSE